MWDIKKDELIIDLRCIISDVNEFYPTNWQIISVASKIYDPLGIIPPITIKWKKFLQDIHFAKIGWDKEISDNLVKLELN